MSDPVWDGLADQAPVTVGATATKLITTAERPGRPWKGVEITPAADIYYGGPGVTTANGTPLAAGVTKFIPVRGRLYAVRAGGSDVVTQVSLAY